jgi:hypothetical protein
MTQLPSIASTESLLTGDESDGDSWSLCYDADAEEDGSTPGGPAFHSPEGARRESRRVGQHQQPPSLRLSEPGTSWRWWGANCEFPRLHVGIDTEFTSLLSSSVYDNEQRRSKRPASDRDPTTRKRKKARVAPPPRPELIGFVSDLSELLLATYREAQNMDFGGPSHKDSRPKHRVDGTSVNERNDQDLLGEAESLTRADPGSDNSNNEEAVNSDRLAFLVSSFSSSGSFVLAPNVRKLDDVLMSFSDSPRVIVEAEAPFRTVHANAAYQRLARDRPVTDGPRPPSNKTNNGMLEAPPFESSTVVYAIRPDPKKCVSHYLVELQPNTMIEVVG